MAGKPTQAETYVPIEIRHVTIVELKVTFHLFVPSHRMAPILKNLKTMPIKQILLITLLQVQLMFMDLDLLLDSLYLSKIVQRCLNIKVAVIPEKYSYISLTNLFWHF